MELCLDFFEGTENERLGRCRIAMLKYGDACTLSSLAGNHKYPAFPLSELGRELHPFWSAVRAVQRKCASLQGLNDLQRFLSLPFGEDFFIKSQNPDSWLDALSTDGQGFVTVVLSICDESGQMDGCMASEILETGLEEDPELPELNLGHFCKSLCNECGKGHFPWEADFYCCRNEESCIVCEEKFGPTELWKSLICGHGMHFSCYVATNAWCPQCTLRTPNFYSEERERKEVALEYMERSIAVDELDRIRLFVLECSDCREESRDLAPFFCHQCGSQTFKIISSQLLQVSSLLSALDQDDKVSELKDLMALVTFYKNNPRLVQGEIAQMRNHSSTPLRTMGVNGPEQLKAFCDAHKAVEEPHKVDNATFNPEVSEEKETPDDDALNKFKATMERLMKECRATTNTAHEGYSDPEDEFNIDEIPSCAATCEESSLSIHFADPTLEFNALMNSTNALLFESNDDCPPASNPGIEEIKPSINDELQTAPLYESSLEASTSESLYPGLTDADRDFILLEMKRDVQ